MAKNDMDALFQSILDACGDLIEDPKASAADKEFAEGVRTQTVNHRKARVAA